MYDFRTGTIGLGVAGNFTGHLEQAGEAADFAAVSGVAACAPKGLFPFYALNAAERLSPYPLSSDRIRLPTGDAGAAVQIEPELALICQLQYAGAAVSGIVPTHFAAYNDCSLRITGATKISQKKNWGADSKGLSASHVELSQFNAVGSVDRFRIASFLKRGSEVFDYGIDSPVNGYSYFYDALLEWVVDRMNHQVHAGPLENISELLASGGKPTTLVLSVGATRYTQYGECHYLQAGDESWVIVYDAGNHDAVSIRQHVINGHTAIETASVLRQSVEL